MDSIAAPKEKRTWDSGSSKVNSQGGGEKSQNISNENFSQVTGWLVFLCIVLCSAYPVQKLLLYFAGNSYCLVSWLDSKPLDPLVSCNLQSVLWVTRALYMNDFPLLGSLTCHVYFCFHIGLALFVLMSIVEPLISVYYLVVLCFSRDHQS